VFLTEAIMEKSASAQNVRIVFGGYFDRGTGKTQKILQGDESSKTVLKIFGIGWEQKTRYEVRRTLNFLTP